MSKTFVRDLRYADMKKIIDSNHHCNWEALARELELLIELPYHQIKFMENGCFEENSPCWNFLENLKLRKPDCTNSTLKQIARKLKRMDIYLFLDKIGNVERIADMNEQQRKELVFYLQQRLTTNDWTMFADELGYSAHEIVTIKESYRYENPTALLLEKLVKFFPDLELKKLSHVWKKIGSVNVYNTINNIL